MGISCKDFRWIYCSDIALDNGKVWLVRPRINGLLELDLQSGIDKVIYRWTDYRTDNWYQLICKIGEKLVVFPSSANEVTVFDLENKKDYLVSIECPGQHAVKYDDTIKFVSYYVDKNEVYLGGYTYPAIMKLNVNNLKTTYIDNWVSAVDDMVIDREYNGYIGCGCVREGNNISFPLLCCPYVLSIDMVTQNYSLHGFDKSLKGLRSLVADEMNNTRWAETIGGDIVHFDNDYTIKKIIHISEDNSAYYWGNYCTPIITDNTVLLYPLRAKKIVVINKTTYNVEPLYNAYERREDSVVGFQMAKRVGDTVYAVCNEDFKWGKYNIKDDTVEWERHFMHSQREMVQEIKEYWKSNIMNEEQDDLNTMLEVLCYE